MVIPLPFSFPQQFGPPTEYALRVRPYFAISLVFLFLIAVGKFYPLLDIWGGFVTLLCIGMGYYAMQDNMNITWISYYGFFSIIQGVLETVKLIEVSVKSPRAFFPKGMPASYYVGSMTMILGPIAFYIGAMLSWWIYKDHTRAVEGTPLLQGGGGDWARREQTPQYGQDPSLVGQPQIQPNASFQPFQGQGQRLGGDA